MAYVSLNPSIKQNVRTDPRAKKRAAEKIKAGERWEFVEGMFGNVYEVKDHERMRYYRQDRPVHNQGDLFEGHLPFACDYCRQIVGEISPVRYTAVYEMLVRPNTNPAWRIDKLDIIFSCCDSCKNGPLPIPPKMIGYHLTELYQDGRLIFKQGRKQ